MHELRRADLQFQLDETAEMFRAGLDRTLADDLIATVVRRTEGWVASLHLVEAAIRDRSDAETRTFIRSLTGARGDLYDYLAEEVVGELEPDVQSFLMRTSIPRVVTVENIELVTGMSAAEAENVLAEIVPIGLLDPAGPDEPDAYRYHPLVREFLESRLRQEQGNDAVIALHRRVAVAHEGRDWRTAAYHYDAINAVDDLQRVLVESAPEIMARGEFDAASRFAAVLGNTGSEPAIEMFTSRVALDRGDIASALRHAQAAYDATRPGPSGLRALALANLMSMNFVAGNAEVAVRMAHELEKSDAPPRLRAIARGSRLAIEASRAGRVDVLQATLEELEEDQRSSKSTHYLGVTLLNIAQVDIHRGRSESAIAHAREAVQILTTGSRRGEANAARMCLAWAYAHGGRWPEAQAEIQDVLAHAEGTVHNDCLIEAAEIWIRYGEIDEAARLTSAAVHHPDPSPLSATHLPLLEAEILLRSGRVTEAQLAFARADPNGATVMGLEARHLYVRSRIAIAEHAEDRVQTASHGLQFAAEQRLDYFAELGLLLRGAAGSNDEFDAAVWDSIRRDRAYVSVVAEEVAARLDALKPPTYARLVDEVVSRPDRWRPILRSMLSKGLASARAAELLDRIGTREDVALVRNFARSSRGRTANRRLGQDLARRVAPRVFVEDMGRVRIEMAGHYLEGLVARRKVLELVCFLITRPDFSATRDEVVDAVWPDTDPPSAINSLNQTLYFLRRVLEPDYAEDLSPNYVHHESDVVWLDSTLVSSRSIRCRNLLKEVGADGQHIDPAQLAAEYRGRFALDFSYEEWAGAFRDTLHAAYLQAMESAIDQRLRDRRTSSAITLARRVLEIDPTAEQVEQQLIRAYHQLGARAAVHEQYEHYARVMRDDLGVEPPSIADVVGDPSVDMNT
jgi:DNA-binding SARP family transcriptional activator